MASQKLILWWENFRCPNIFQSEQNWKHLSYQLIQLQIWEKLGHLTSSICPKRVLKLNCMNCHHLWLSISFLISNRDGPWLDPTRAYFWPEDDQSLTWVLFDRTQRDFFDPKVKKLKNLRFLGEFFHTQTQTKVGWADPNHKKLTQPDQGKNVFGHSSSLRDSWDFHKSITDLGKLVMKNVLIECECECEMLMPIFNSTSFYFSCTNQFSLSTVCMGQVPREFSIHSHSCVVL